MDVLFRGGPLDGKRHRFDRAPTTFINFPTHDFGVVIYRVAEQIAADLVVYEFAEITQ